MANVRLQEASLTELLSPSPSRAGWVVLPGGRSDLPVAPPSSAQLLRTLPAAFARFCELCPERGLVNRQNLVDGVLTLARTSHPGTDFVTPRADSLDLPIAAGVRDALWQAGRSGRLESLRAALAQAQLRLSLSVR